MGNIPPVNAGNQTLTCYDALDRVIETTLPEGNSVAYTYDFWSHPLTITRHAKPGSLDPLTGKFPADQITAVTYTSPVAALPNFEEAQTVTDPLTNKTINYYDSSTGNLLETDQPPVPKNGATGPLTMPKTFYTYTAIGLPQSYQDAKCRLTVYNYDTTHADEVTSVTIDSSGPQQTSTCLPASTQLNLVTTYGYDAYGDVNAVTDANNNKTTRIYDTLRRVTEVDAPASIGAAIQYSFTADGQVQTIARKATLSPVTWLTTHTYRYVC